MSRFLLLLACCALIGCGPGQEVQYLQAAEEVKAAETKLAELERDAAAKMKLFDESTITAKLKAELILTRAETDAAAAALGSSDDPAKAKEKQEKIMAKAMQDTQALLEGSKAEAKLQARAVARATLDAEDQRKIVDAARVRRDALAVTK